MIIKSITKQFLLMVNILVADSKFVGWLAIFSFLSPALSSLGRRMTVFPIILITEFPKMEHLGL